MHKIVQGLIVSAVVGTALLAGGKGVSIAAIEPMVIPETDASATSMWSDRLYNVGLTAGTLGLGINVATAINDSFQLRLNVNGARHSATEKMEDINFDADLKFINAGLLVDYFPFESVGFHLTGGAYYNGNQVNGTATPVGTEQIEIGNNTYGVDKLGHLDAEASFDKFAPYVGLGWGNDSRSEGFGFSLDVGVLAGRPEVTLTPTINNELARAEIEADIIREQKAFDDDLDRIKVYPVVMFGVTYTF